MITVAIGHQEPFVRRNLRAVLERTATCTVVGEASDGAALLDLNRKLRSKVLMVGASLPGFSMTEAVRVVTQKGVGVKIIGIAPDCSEWTPTMLIGSGFAGCLAQDDFDQAGRAVEIVARGGFWFSQGIVDIAASERLRERLSKREVDVLALLVRGLTDREIAEQLTISVKTVRNHVNSIYGKLGVHNRAQAITWAIRHRMASVDGQLLAKR